MDHHDFPVTIYDQNGNKIGTKKRREVNKFCDIIECVEVLIFTPNKKIVLTRILNKPSEVYAGKLGVPVASIRRDDETEIDTAKRAMKDELLLEHVEPIFVGRDFLTMETGINKWLTVFYVVTDIDLENFNTERIGTLSLYSVAEVENLITENIDVAGTLTSIWKKYKTVFPV